MNMTNFLMPSMTSLVKLGAPLNSHFPQLNIHHEGLVNSHINGKVFNNIIGLGSGFVGRAGVPCECIVAFL